MIDLSRAWPIRYGIIMAAKRQKISTDLDSNVNIAGVDVMAAEIQGNLNSTDDIELVQKDSRCMRPDCRFCFHCDQLLSLKTYKAHKRRFGEEVSDINLAISIV